jgi:hypothetical protein
VGVLDLKLSEHVSQDFGAIRAIEGLERLVQVLSTRKVNGWLPYIPAGNHLNKSLGYY